LGAEPISKVIRADRAAEPARMKSADDPVANLDARHAVADRRDFAGTIAQRHDAELRRTATTAFEDHQISVIE
jgi:hypothetical protein